MTDAKEWVTTKVPKEDRDTANDLKPEDATYGDCLVAGARALSEDASPIDRHVAGENAVEIADELNLDMLPAMKGDIDTDAIARAVSQQIDYAHIADSVADELEGRMR